MLPTVGFVMGLFWAVAVVLVLVAFARVRERLGAPRRSGDLGDDEIRAIEETGTLRRDDEPLDIHHIEQEERRFWDEEEWDGAEEW